MLKIKFLLGLLLFSSLAVKAQSKIGYSYDSSGNRVERTIVLETVKKAKASPEIERSFTDNIDERNVKIYPNPTQGQLRIDISRLGNGDKCTLSLYTISGDLIFKDSNAGTTNCIDISNQKTGLYLLKITINENTSTWKIIKQ